MNKLLITIKKITLMDNPHTDFCLGIYDYNSSLDVNLYSFDFTNSSSNDF